MNQLLQLKIWDANCYRLRHSVKSSHRLNIFCNDTKIVSCSADTRVCIANVGKDESRVITCHTDMVHKVALEPGSPEVILSAGEDGTVRQFDTRQAIGCPSSRECAHCVVNLRERWPGRVALNPQNSHYFVVAGNDPVMRVYDRRKLNGRSLPCVSYMPNISRHAWPYMTSAVFSYDGSQLLGSYSNIGIHLFDFDGKRAATGPTLAPGTRQSDSEDTSSIDSAAESTDTAEAELQAQFAEFSRVLQRHVAVMGDLLGGMRRAGRRMSERETSENGSDDEDMPAARRRRINLSHESGSESESEVDREAHSPSSVEDMADVIAQRWQSWRDELQAQDPDSDSDGAEPADDTPSRRETAELIRRNARTQSDSDTDVVSEFDTEDDIDVALGDEDDVDEVDYDDGLDGSDDDYDYLNPFDMDPEGEVWGFAHEFPTSHWPLTREMVLDGVEPVCEHVQQYNHHINLMTTKEVSFFGPRSEYVVSGSDCGHIFIWEKDTGKLVQQLRGDNEVVNVVQGHPFDCRLVTSGIDYGVKLWSPIADHIAKPTAEPRAYRMPYVNF